MALQKTIVFKGIPVDAYIRVSDFSGNKNGLTYALSYHASSDSPSFDQTVHACAFDLDGPNALAQAYAHAKTLPEFAGAVDV